MTALIVLTYTGFVAAIGFGLGYLSAPRWNFERVRKDAVRK